MRINQVRLVNFCQHRDTTVAFSPNLNLISGPNGSGKSNLLRGMQMALTGDAGGVGTKQEDIAQLADPAEPSFVEILMEHDGNRYEITRSLRPVSNRLLINGERFGRTVTEIEQELLTRLCTTKQQIADYVFVRQRGIDSWLDKRPADRSKELSELFGISQMEKIWTALGTASSQLEVPEIPSDESDMLSQLEAKQVRLSQVVLALELYREVPEDITDYLLARSELRQQAEARLQVVAQLEIFHHNQAVNQQSLATAARVLAEATTDHELICTAAEATRETAAAAQAGMDQWREWNVMQASREALQEAEGSLPPTPTPPDKPDTYVCDADWSAFEASRDLWQSSLLSLEHEWESIKDAQQGDECPTCGQAGYDPEPRKVEVRQRREEIAAELKPMLLITSARREYEREFKLYTQLLQEQEYRIAELQRLRSAVQQVAEPSQTEAELTVIIQELNALWTDVTKAEKRQAVANASHVAAAAVAASDDQLVATAEQQLADLPVVTQHDVDTANAEAVTMRQRHAEASVLQEEAGVLRNSVSVSTQYLAKCTEIRTRRDRVLDSRDHLDALRQIFHRDELPRIVTYTYLEQMGQDINETLTLFEAPFQVEPDEALGFTATFLDGRRVSDRRLSVGERIVLALAFRIAVNSTFAGSLGMLLLDEPTAGLDDHNLGCLPHALARLRNISESRGLQVMFVTHEPRISDLFDRVINVSDVA